MENELLLGGIYKTQFDERPFRIIGLDETEVSYDCLWSDNNWTFSGSFRGKSIFYRMPVDFFKLKSNLIDFKELSEEEFKYFRPDLPMRFGQTSEVNWNNIDSQSLELLKSKFANLKLGTDKIILVPYGPNDGLKKGVQIESKEKLNIFEIIQKAITIQESVNEEESDGIGFYRLGYEKGLPRYSIGEFKSE